MWSGRWLRGTRRQLGVAQPQKTALEIDALRSVVLAIPDDLRGRRDRALLLVGWTAALRRSELVALEVVDLAFEPEGGRADDPALEDRPRGGPARPSRSRLEEKRRAVRLGRCAAGSKRRR